MKRLFKDKRGMTLMEILVALSLLLIVIVGTTPVMLSAYDGLYLAGEKTKETYDAKSEMEDTLATRNTNIKYEGFEISLKNVGENFNAVGEVASVNAKRAVSSLYTTLETVFSGGRAHLAIVSSKVINDDKTTQEVIIQTTNILFEDENDISTNQPNNIKNTVEENKKNKIQVDISAYLPNKTKTNLIDVYNAADNTRKATVEKVSANPQTGRIVIKISGMDFTTSPVKIQATYIDENYKKKTTHCYLTVKTPTIMLAGETTYGDYYTSAGLETKTATDGTTYNTFKVDSRRMRIYEVATKDLTTSYEHAEGNNPTIEIKGGITKIKTSPLKTVFKSVTWVNNDSDTDQIEPYYVMTGTNGAMYRTYSFTGASPSLSSKVVRQNEASQIILDDSQSTAVYPSLWGGDDSYHFGYSTYNKSMGYAQGDWCWYTEDTNSARLGYTDERAKAYSTEAKYSYYYNGWGLQYSYDNQKARTISYILTEQPYALRMGGWMQAFEAGYNENYNKIWENVDNDDLGVGGSVYDTGKNLAKSSVFDDSLEVVYYAKYGRTESPATGRYMPYYLSSYGTDAKGNRFRDANFAQIRIKYLSTVRDYVFWDRRDRSDKNLSDNILLKSSSEYQSKITVTDAVYIPHVTGADGTTGKMFYIGTVDAHAYLNQIDNLGPDSNGNGDHWAHYVFWQSLDDWDQFKKWAWSDPKYEYADNYGRKTVYFVSNKADGSGTEVYKYSIAANAEDYFNDTNTYNPLKAAAYGTTNDSGTFVSATKPSTYIQSNTTEARSFFVTRLNGAAKSTIFSDVAFTMGYTSNRDMAYAQITYGIVDSNGTRKEAYKGCEPYFFQSRYGNSAHKARLYMNNKVDTTGLTTDYRNSVDNDYYNVWFPGEMYNLTKVVTKDNVTVAVGYAVSGTTYQFVNPDNEYNTSTALSGVHNDGVLACMIAGKDTSFKNLLYFKDTHGFDSTSLTSASSALNASKYQSAYGSGVNYGTHQRNSVQFTSVDISKEYIKLSSTQEKAEYYAYYADNRGRLFKSLVATNTTTNSGYNPDENETITTIRPTMVDWISDQPYNPAPSGSKAENVTSSNMGKMVEITVNGKSVGDYFSKITSVKCEGDFIFVSGYPKTGIDDKYNVVVGYIKQSADGTSNTVHWRVLTINSGTSTPTVTNLNQTETSFTLDGVLYLAGSFKNQQTVNSVNYRGWVYALPIATVREAFADIFYTDKTDAGGNTITVTPVTSITALSSHYALTQDRLYAGDGHTSD